MDLGITAISTFIGVIIGQFIFDKYKTKKEVEYIKTHTKRLDVNELTDIQIKTNEDSTKWLVTLIADDKEYSFENIKDIKFGLNENDYCISITTYQ